MTFRVKLVAIVAIATLSMVALAVSSAIYEARVAHHVESIQQSYVPKIRLRPQLVSAFEALTRGFQDAVDAHDQDRLAAVETQHQGLIALIASAHDALTPGQIAVLRYAVDDYDTAATTVSHALLAGPTGEAVLDGVKAMQAKQVHASQLIEQATDFDERELARAFDATAEEHDVATTVRLIVCIACVVVLLAMSIWLGRGVFRSLGELVAGFRRFGAGDFTSPIPAERGDELGAVAVQANQMASRLEELATERQRSDWVKAGHAGVVDEIRGELEPEEVADRALAVLARHLGAGAAALYYGPPGGPFVRLGRYAIRDAELPATVARGEGLVGQAAMRTEPTVVDGPPDGLALRAGLVERAAASLVLQPLVHAEQVTGVLEFALAKPHTAQDLELLALVRAPVAIAIEVARGRSAARALLLETQRQAEALIAAHASLEQKAAELATASVYKSQFLANMSHELRTPLNAIIGFSELLFDGSVPQDAPEHKEYLGDIMTSGRHLLQLINDVLDLSKVEAGKLEFVPEPIRLSTVIAEVLAVLRSEISSRRIGLTTELAADIGNVVLDPARLKQVIYNFLSNALKFTGPGGRVVVRTLPAGPEQFRFEVEDTGSGIPEHELARLWVDFQQTRTGAQRGGTGLGLALTKRLVEAQGGSVGVASVVGRGSTFHAVFPREHAIAAMIASDHGAPAEPAKSGGPTVLVIEDDRAFRSQLGATLAGNGYVVETVATGREAIERTRARSYDAITLDMFLPDMTGLEILRALQSGKNRDVPVVVITVVAEPGAVAGFAVHDILPKPLDERLLLDSLDRAGCAPNQSLRVLVVDDDVSALKVMGATLGQHGYLATCEPDAQKALVAARATPPSAIVLDLIMPGISGFQFLDALHRDPDAVKIPVIIWTSKDLSTEELATLKRSALAVIPKGDGNQRVLTELASALPKRIN